LFNNIIWIVNMSWRLLRKIACDSFYSTNNDINTNTITISSPNTNNTNSNNDKTYTNNNSPNANNNDYNGTIDTIIEPNRKKRKTSETNNNPYTYHTNTTTNTNHSINNNTYNIFYEKYHLSPKHIMKCLLYNMNQTMTFYHRTLMEVLCCIYY